MESRILAVFAARSAEALYDADPQLSNLLEAEYDRQQHTLSMVASCSVTDPSVLACEGSCISNVTAEGYPGARYHAGCTIIDQIEELAVRRAKSLFGAAYANVQPLSASIANQIVIASLLSPGETLLGMSLDAGGHLSHGARVNISGRHFNAISYGLDASGFIDYEGVAELARIHKPRLIICGTTSYPRCIKFDRFRAIADEVGAWLLADITHIAGLVASGQHSSPIDIAHVTTTCTHKQLFGPRGGLIMSGRDWQSTAPTGEGTLADLFQRGVFPLYQGAPAVTNIAAKARAFERAATAEFQQLGARIVMLARGLAQEFTRRGMSVVSGGTENHIVVVDIVRSFGISGFIAQRALEECGIIVNKNRIVGDTKPAAITSGIRFGTNSAAARGFDVDGIDEFSELLVKVLSSVESFGDRDYRISPDVVGVTRRAVEDLCERFPLPRYPSSSHAGIDHDALHLKGAPQQHQAPMVAVS